MRRAPKVHAACHAAHVRDWPMHAKVWITWGIQGWVPAVVIGYSKNRVQVRIAGRAQSGATVSMWGRAFHSRGIVGRSPNNIAPRRSDGDFPAYRTPASCLARSEKSA